MKPVYWVAGIAVLLFSKEVFAMLGVSNRSGLSQAGLDFIAKREGWGPTKNGMTYPYKDSAGLATIGIGHLIQPSHQFVAGKDQPITKAEALQLFEDDIAKFANGVRASVRVPLAQHELDALVSFAFNTGLPAFKKSTLLKKLNAGDRAAVPAEMLRWVKITDPKTGELVTSEPKIQRRVLEGRIFSQGIYG